MLFMVSTFLLSYKGETAMGLVSMKPMLRVARDEGYGVAAFNIIDFLSTKAIIEAAEEIDSPVIVQTSVKTIQFWGHSAVSSWVHEIAKDKKVPIAFHLDHCKEVDIIRQCIDHNWTSVMIDASDKPFEENLALTKQVVDMAEKAGVGCEAELGQIVGVEDDMFVHENDAQIPPPEAAIAFCKGLPLSVFAPAIGTAHGYYQGEPDIQYENIEIIARETGIPIALHGGTGLEDEVFKRCISLGCAKVNISTHLKEIFIDSFVNFHLENKKYEPLAPLKAQEEVIFKETQRYMTLFGGEGRGASDCKNYDTAA